jgi:hypothetical protein
MCAAGNNGDVLMRSLRTALVLASLVLAPVLAAAQSGPTVDVEKAKAFYALVDKERSPKHVFYLAGYMLPEGSVCHHVLVHPFENPDDTGYFRIEILGCEVPIVVEDQVVNKSGDLMATVFTRNGRVSLGNYPQIRKNAEDFYPSNATLVKIVGDVIAQVVADPKTE